MDKDLVEKIADYTVCIIIIAIIILKLVGVITISWWWLTAIIWVPFLVGMGLVTVLMIALAIERTYYKIKEKINE